MTPSSPILVILGPTASGKSDLAMRLARRVGGEILSVDSMQVYREMDIGTAKPTAAEMSEVRHHCVDLVGPAEAFTTARFVERADQVIAQAKAASTPLIAAGGTPLYFKALFQGLFQGPGEDADLRRELKSRPPEQLRRQLLEVDPEAAGRIHVNDIRRMVRALEVYELTGRPISSFQTEWESESCRHEAAWIGLDWPRESLNRRINARVRGMIEAGWLQETRRLMERYGNLSKTAVEATGYRQLIEHLEGKITLEEAAERIKIATRQLARRQTKWFRRFEAVHWLEGAAGSEVLVDRAMEIWTGGENY